jgi:ABC-type multidrug transport system fused ATPase/permease subunit
MSVFVRILRLLRPHAPIITGALFCLLLGTAASLIQPILSQTMIDKVLNGKRWDLFWSVVVGMLVCGCIAAGAGALRTWLQERTGQRFVLSLRRKLYAHLQSQSLSFFHDRRTGDLIARVVGDIDTLQEVVINGTDTFLSNILSMVGVAAIMIAYNWKLGLATVLPVFVTFTLMYRYNRKVKPVYRSARDKLGDVSAKLQENLLGVQTVKAFAREEQAAAKFEDTIQAFFLQNLLGISLRAKFMPLVQFFSITGSVIMVSYGAYLIMKEEVTIGTLLAFRWYWWQLYGPVYSIAGINDVLQRGAAAGGRVFELLDTVPEIRDAEDAKALPKVRGEVVFENVSFDYSSRGGVLKNVSLHVAPGTRVGLAGPSGAGKSTLLNLLPRFHDPNSGKILIDGYDLRSVKQATLRRQIGMVLQESFLFNDAVLENIRFGRPDATREDVERAARDANAHEFIAKLPQGYDTLVGERGVKLSGGQRQRIAIARAFLTNPAILLLDEATSAVEPESETIIQQALEVLMAGRTSFIVSHRLSVIRPCDLILVLEHGAIAEQGTHQTLLDRGGLYAQMYRMQMGDEGGDNVAKEAVKLVSGGQ